MATGLSPHHPSTPGFSSVDSQCVGEDGPCNIICGGEVTTVTGTTLDNSDISSITNSPRELPSSKLPSSKLLGSDLVCTVRLVFIIDEHHCNLVVVYT